MRGIKRLLIPLGVVCGLFVTGCQTRQGDLAVYSVDLDNPAIVTINPDSIVWLETSDSSLIYDISNLERIGETMIVQSRNLVKRFGADGSYKGNMTQRGDAPGEFIYFGNMWVADTVFHLYDATTHHSLKFLEDGTYLGYDTLAYIPTQDFEPEEIHDAGDMGVFYLNKFMGVPPFRTLLSHAADYASKPMPVEGRERTDGITMYNRVFVDSAARRLLYWEPVRDTLFVADASGMSPLLKIDFGKHSVPAEITAPNSTYDRFAALEKIGMNEYAYPMRFFQVANGRIYFFVPAGRNGYICCLDESKGKGVATRFAPPEGSTLLPQLFYKIEGDRVMLSVIDESNAEANPGLFMFPLSAIAVP